MVPVGAREPVIYVVRVSIDPRDHARRVNCDSETALACARARARSVERSDSAFWHTQEDMSHAARVSVGSHDFPRRVNAIAVHGASALPGGRSSVRSIKLCDAAIRYAHIAVSYIARICVGSAYQPGWIDTTCPGS
jgi:hypothetical protein